MRRPAFVLFLFVLVALVSAPDVARRFMDIDAPWLGWVQAGLMAAGVVFAARARLRDAGKPEGWLWRALLVVTPVYALFASAVAGLLPIPSQLSTLALIGANGLVFGGLITLALLPSAYAATPAKPRRSDSDGGFVPATDTSSAASSGKGAQDSGSDSGSSDWSSSSDGGGDGGGD
ncbi:hypothetical protein [Asticcacaulis excentricus]|uniref:Uncharacterized protein n=1 Tax=Asticcacaulis excentricus (strain ATCC 15261 / DSM 4724 / KCTC 12464 / NCIMB 9791 / VKM B-1370 / CB 48) TaxID=573065 RepID=E8RKT4_ASTEC|nr:hypothetical protein [Asticcacaulis excentricus]ADU12494.1 hypothetical protein Astex_0810 [Asticcacaulis excentricus CB 48]